MSTPTMQIQPAGTVRVERAVRKFHASLNVSDLTRSIAFYTELFGVAPAKVYHDYNKFELEEPPSQSGRSTSSTMTSIITGPGSRHSGYGTGRDRRRRRRRWAA